MKHLIVLLCLVPVLSFSQVSNWRSNPPQASFSAPSIQSQRSDVSNWRIDPPRSNRTTQPFIIDYGWGWNRWNMWGAPAFGWNFWQPMWYLNDWGYRQPGRVYVYENGKRDTILGKKPIYNFGIQKSTDKQIGGFFAVGNKSYFITEFNTTYDKDNSTFFPYGELQGIDFPLVEDQVRIKTFYAGIGKRFKRTGFHIMLGTVNERVRWRGKDAVGYITFPKYHTTNMTAKFGIIQDIKTLTIKIDYDPFIKTATMGLGLNF